ncbi:hypothetical protein IKE96_00295 [bacterium]|nr:hypothetical protein [bacterium]
METVKKMSETVSETYVPSNTLSVVKGKTTKYVNALKKDMDDLATSCANFSTIHSRIVKNGAILGNYNGKSAKKTISKIAKTFNDRKAACRERSKRLTESIQVSTDNMASQLVSSCKNWEEYQNKFKQYEL